MKMKEGIFVKDNAVYACALSGSSAGNYLIIKIPTSGSLTGTYDGGNYVYQSSSLTSATSSLTDAASTLTDSGGNLTDSTPSLTDQTSTFSSSTISLG